MKKVIYIMGYGRSGSTILDILLSNHNEVVSAGALINIFDEEMRRSLCGCGKPQDECEFWSGVKNDYYAEAPYKTPEENDELCQRVESRPHFTTLLPKIVHETTKRDYRKSTELIFHIIGEKSGKDVVVDSSKSAGRTQWRAYTLSKLTSLDVRIIHLIRDGRGVMWSALKRPGSPERQSSQLPSFFLALKTLVHWIVTNTLCCVLARNLKKGSVCTVRYEDLVAEPETTLRRLGDFLDLELTSVIQKVRNHEPIGVGHNLGGNRVRLTTNISLKADLEWRDRLSRVYKIMYWILAWPIALRFGYITWMKVARE